MMGDSQRNARQAPVPSASPADIIRRYAPIPAPESSQPAQNLPKPAPNLQPDTAVDFGPLRLPRGNPFVQPYSHYEQDGEEHLQAAEQQLRRCVEIVAGRYGYLNEDLISFILKYVPGVVQSNYSEHRTKVLDYQAEMQLHTLSWAKLRMYTLVERTGGIAAWESSTTAHKTALLTTLFNQFPITMCKIVFAYEANVWHFENIWAGDTAKHIKWQTFCRSVFVDITLAAYRYHVRPLMLQQHQQLSKEEGKEEEEEEESGKEGKEDEDEDKDEEHGEELQPEELLVKTYKTCRRTANIARLGLGDARNVPTHPTPPRGSRARPS